MPIEVGVRSEEMWWFQRERKVGLADREKVRDWDWDWMIELLENLCQLIEEKCWVIRQNEKRTNERDG
jgi:hypothetical protein